MRAVAVYGIGLIGGPGAGLPVLRALHDTTGAVRISALDATNRLEYAHTFTTAQSKQAFASSSGFLRAPEDAVRARAATTLASFSGGPQGAAAATALASAFKTERSAFVRWHEMWSLYRGYASLAPHQTLLSGLRDSDDVVRIEAVRAIGRRGDKRDVAALEPLTRDSSWRVQEQAFESLGALQGKPPTEHFLTIPRGINVPPRARDPFASLRALPRPQFSGKPQPPSAQNVITEPKLDPGTVETIAGPAHGPHPRVRIVTTQGNIYVELYPEWAPLTVGNFLNLANEGYYDGNPWFRIVPDFVVQSGDPSATAAGPGYTIPAEENPIEQDSYVISMGLDYTNPPNAHAKRDSAASEFYITLSPQLHLNSDFTVFGRVVSGFDVLGRLVESDRIERIERIPDAK